jgi:hypothetical protein
VAADDHRSIAGVFQAIVHAAQGFVEEGRGNILHHDTDGHRPAFFQALRHLVGRELHFFDGGQHGIALVVGDRAVPLRMRETVLGETPAWRATSIRVEGPECRVLSAKDVLLLKWESTGYENLFASRLP